MDKLKLILEAKQNSFTDKEHIHNITGVISLMLLKRKLRREKKIRLMINTLFVLLIWLLITFFIVFSETVFSVKLSEAFSFIALSMAASLILLQNILQNIFIFIKGITDEKT